MVECLLCNIECMWVVQMVSVWLSQIYRGMEREREREREGGGGGLSYNNIVHTILRCTCVVSYYTTVHVLIGKYIITSCKREKNILLKIYIFLQSCMCKYSSSRLCLV